MYLGFSSGPPSTVTIMTGVNSPVSLLKQGRKVLLEARKVLLNKKKSNNLDSKTVSMPSGKKIYINESLYTCYKKLWSKCKKLKDAKHILSFWMSNDLIRVKLKNEAVFIITHDCDLANLFPDNRLIDDY